MKNYISLIPAIKKLYENGENLMQYLKANEVREFNSVEDILISYDFQAGTYVDYANENKEFIFNYTSELASVITGLGDFTSLLEVGVGEATTLTNLIHRCCKPQVKYFGFDISWSRIKVGMKYLDDNNISAKLFVADLFNIPLFDNSIDVVYTSHSLEPNGGREKQALKELYRVTKKYLVLLEPESEFATEDGKIRMQKNGYINNLVNVIRELNYELINYSKFPICANELNPTALYVIKKNDFNHNVNDNLFKDPISSGYLKENEDHFFCKDSMLSYPKINKVPCLCPSYAILTSKNE